MSALAAFIGAPGTWRATYALRDPGNTLSCDSESEATVTPVLGGRFVRLDYTWSFKGAPQEGSLLVGVEQASGVATVAWIDSFHNGDRLMPCTGRAEAGVVDVRGTYAAPPGPDWGWRTRLSATPGTLSMVMFNITPDGHEELAVDAQYRRA
jgi:hypothetical protein